MKRPLILALAILASGVFHAWMGRWERNIERWDYHYSEDAKAFETTMLRKDKWLIYIDGQPVDKIRGGGWESPEFRYVQVPKPGYSKADRLPISDDPKLPETEGYWESPWRAFKDTF